MQNPDKCNKNKNHYFFVFYVSSLYKKLNNYFFFFVPKNTYLSTIRYSVLVHLHTIIQFKNVQCAKYFTDLKCINELETIYPQNFWAKYFLILPKALNSEIFTITVLCAFYVEREHI